MSRTVVSKRRRTEEHDTENRDDDSDHCMLVASSSDEDQSDSRSEEEEESDNEESSEAPEELARCAQIVERTHQLAEKLEKKYGNEAAEILTRAREARERMIKAAISAWFTRNFAMPNAAVPLSPPEHHSVAHLFQDETKGFSRHKLREIVNTYLALLRLPRMSKRNSLWINWLLKEIIGLEESEWKSGRPITVRDQRSLENFEKTLYDLLKVVEKERREDGGNTRK